MIGDNYPTGVNGSEPEIAGDANYERAGESVDEQIEELLVEDVEASEDFICFMFDGKKGSLTLDRLINDWLETDYGRKWYIARVEEVVNGQGEAPEHDQ